ncbi:hypothetical protein HD806DRAFT_416966 [Xylariaceae sp. AK1471]|nr:hypothetical protein HD806DRAFT_416966 [Xylariaceae sp. AK1471]
MWLLQSSRSLFSNRKIVSTIEDIILILPLSRSRTGLSLMSASSKINKTSTSELTMPSGRENKKGFRAKPMGLTVDTNLAQKASNKGTGNTEPTMTTGQENKKGFRAKTLNLTVNTKLAQDAPKADTTAHALATKPARRVGNAEGPKLSEALMNRNWRNPRRAQEDTEDTVTVTDDIWSAPPEQSKFPGEFKTKPQRNDEHEIIDYDRGLERAAYRSRRPEEVKPELVPFTKSENVDAGLCLSAPATKLEFTEAEIGGEERSQKYNPSVFQPSVKSIVRLDELAPAKRAGYEKVINWDEQHHLQDSVSITAVSPADISSAGWEMIDLSYAELREKLELPYAEIRAVKGDHKFQTELSGVEEELRIQLANLVEPQSAGLPPEYLRKEYEAKREERRKAMALVRSSIMDGTMLQGCPDSVGSNKLSTEGGKENKFNALLGKLNRLCAPRLRALTVKDKNAPNGLKTSDGTEKTVSGDPQRSPSQDSGISGLSSGGRKRSSTLNPQAVEFCCPLQEKHSEAVNGSDSSIAGLPVSASPIATTADITTAEVLASKDPIRLLATRVAELEAQLGRQQSKKVQPVRQKWDNGSGWQGNPMATRGGTRYHSTNRKLHGPTGYPVSQPIPAHQGLSGIVAGVGGMPVNSMPVMAPYGSTQNGPGIVGHPNIMQAMVPYQGNGFVGQANTTQAMVPYQGNGFAGQANNMETMVSYHGNRAPATTRPVGGTTWWAKAIFGPKPVSKPDRPFRPGDKTQAQRQQEYEEYLEHLRTTDPDYALKCKYRQARRAERQRYDFSSDVESMGPD